MSEGKHSTKGKIKVEKKQRLGMLPGMTYEEFGEMAMRADYRKEAPYILSMAVRAKCIDCCCWQPVEVALCTAYTCPLWPYRLGYLNQDDNTEACRKKLIAEGMPEKAEKLEEA